MMEKIYVESSNLKYVSYDPDNLILRIEFGKYDAERVYQYFDVPEEIYNGLMEFPSHGKFFHWKIINRFKFEYLGTSEELDDELED